MTKQLFFGLVFVYICQTQILWFERFTACGRQSCRWFGRFIGCLSRNIASPPSMNPPPGLISCVHSLRCFSIACFLRFATMSSRPSATVDSDDDDNFALLASLQKNFADMVTSPGGTIAPSSSVVTSRASVNRGNAGGASEGKCLYIWFVSVLLSRCVISWGGCFYFPGGLWGVFLPVVSPSSLRKVAMSGMLYRKLFTSGMVHKPTLHGLLVPSRPIFAQPGYPSTGS